MQTEGMGEPASEFLLRMAVHPNIKPADKKKMREAAYLFIAYLDQINQLKEENRLLRWEIEDPAAANREIPF